MLKSLTDKTIILGVLDLSTHEVETPQIVAERIERALPYVDAKRIVVAPDCGLKYLPRDVAFGKMKAMADGARIMREKLAAEMSGKLQLLLLPGMFATARSGARRSRTPRYAEPRVSGSARSKASRRWPTKYCAGAAAFRAAGHSMAGAWRRRSIARLRNVSSSWGCLPPTIAATRMKRRALRRRRGATA